MSPDPTSPNRLEYAPRKVARVAIVQNQWTAKVYSITSDARHHEPRPSVDLLKAAVYNAMPMLDTEYDHPLGFAIVHFANDGTYLLLTRFNNANNIRHRVFSVRQKDQHIALDPLGDPNLIACVWELRLMRFEADTWIKAVLEPENGLSAPARARYLDTWFEGSV